MASKSTHLILIMIQKRRHWHNLVIIYKYASEYVLCKSGVNWQMILGVIQKNKLINQQMFFGPIVKYCMLKQEKAYWSMSFI